jgi:hypothetical protein
VPIRTTKKGKFRVYDKDDQYVATHSTREDAEAHDTALSSSEAEDPSDENADPAAPASDDSGAGDGAAAAGGVVGDDASGTPMPTRSNMKSWDAPFRKLSRGIK